jgi:hypothetical protein
MDSGPQLFMDGRYYYRQIGDLAVNLCGAKTLSDEDWREYLRGSLDVAHELGRGPNVSLIAFAGAHPNAGQRRISADFMKKERVRPIERVAILTDSELLRGAMTAFGWLVPNLKYRPFKPSDSAGALAWLREVGQFDEKTALEAWAEAKSTVSIGR